MRTTFVVIFVLVLALIPAIISFTLPDEEKFDEVRQLPSSPFYPSFAFDRLNGPPECLLKSQLFSLLQRDRRASISRPYFYHWRPTRELARFSGKNSLAFSPRLGKRSLNVDDIEDDNEINRLTSRATIETDSFLSSLISHLKTKKIDTVYEDANRICFSQSITDALIQQVIEKIESNRRLQDELEKEEMRNNKQTMAKHPVLFRYRLG